MGDQIERESVGPLETDLAAITELPDAGEKLDVIGVRSTEMAR